MDQKTIHAIMEEITELYDQKPYLSINDYYICRCDVFVHLSHLGDGSIQFILAIAKKYDVHWVIQPQCSVDGDIAINFYGGK